MSRHSQARWLVTYDIVKPRNLTRVFRLLKKNGVPVQYSVFFVPGNAAQIEVLMGQLAKLIDGKTDDVRAYRLPEDGWTAHLGAAILPQDIWIDPEGKPR